MTLNIKPEITATLEHRKASSSCCGAKVDMSERVTGQLGMWICRGCGKPCGRVLGPPQEVTAHG